MLHGNLECSVPGSIKIEGILVRTIFLQKCCIASQSGVNPIAFFASLSKLAFRIGSYSGGQIYLLTFIGIKVPISNLTDRTAAGDER